MASGLLVEIDRVPDHGRRLAHRQCRRGHLVVGLIGVLGVAIRVVGPVAVGEHVLDLIRIVAVGVLGERSARRALGRDQQVVRRDVVVHEPDGEAPHDVHLDVGARGQVVDEGRRVDARLVARATTGFRVDGRGGGVDVVRASELRGAARERDRAQIVVERVVTGVGDREREDVAGRAWDHVHDADLIGHDGQIDPPVHDERDGRAGDALLVDPSDLVIDAGAVADARRRPRSRRAPAATSRKPGVRPRSGAWRTNSMRRMGFTILSFIN